MILLDANILLYAYDSESPRQQKCADWLNALFQRPEYVGIPWVAMWAFVRVRTSLRAVSKPATIAESFAVIREWRSLPNVVVVEPGKRHAGLLEYVASTYDVSGPLLSDAVIAALALENGAAVASTDRDFSRFKEIRWINPLDLAD